MISFFSHCFSFRCQTCGLRIFFKILSIITAIAAILLSAEPTRATILPDSRPDAEGVKLTITKDGIYRVTGADLAGAGVKIEDKDPADIRLFCADTEIPFILDASGKTFGTEDAIIFYGQSYSDIYTRKNVYWIYFGEGQGTAMQSRDAAPESGTEPVTTFTATITLEENHTMWTETPGAPDVDFWFWQKMSPPDSDSDSDSDSSLFSFSFDLPHITAKDALLSFFFQGSSAATHTLSITINGKTFPENIEWSGKTEKTVPHTVDNLYSISNNITLTAIQGDVPDSFYFNKLSVSYERELTADNNRIHFFITPDSGGEKPLKLSGFTDPDIMILDVTDPKNPIRLDKTTISGTSPYTLSFQHPGGKHDYFAAAASGMLSPENMVLMPAPDIADTTNSADYIIITARDLIPATAKLLELRRRQGFYPMAVSLEDIYDTFSGGRFSPQAIADFIDYAYHNWQPPRLSYVLLAGDANIDYLDNYHTGKKNVVPPLILQMPGLGLTPTDNPYACVSGDDFIPDLMIGRIPGNNTDDIEKIVNKLIFYETGTGPGPDRALFVADDDSTSFETSNDYLTTYLPENFTPTKVYARKYSSFKDVTDDIISALDMGMLITNYIGHGDVFHWGVEPFGGGDFILTGDDLSRLTGSETPTFVISLDCLNGYFAQVERHCLAEEWLLADGGAIGCFAPSGLGYQWDYTRLNSEIFSEIFDNYNNRLGAIARNAKINAYSAGASADILNSFQLIGDPATRLDIYRDTSSRVMVFAVNASADTGGTISPAGKIPVFDGDAITFTVIANSGYDISDVLVDGESKGAVSSLTLKDVHAEHTVRATFKSNRPASGGGGGGGCFIQSIGRYKDLHIAGFFP